MLFCGRNWPLGLTRNTEVFDSTVLSVLVVRWELTNQAYLDRNLEKPFLYNIVKLHLFFKFKIVLIFYVISWWALHLNHLYLVAFIFIIS